MTTSLRHAPALDGATTWLNSEPLTPVDLRGHVVAYDIGTYTCVNWLRTLPYVRAWANRYRDHGLIVVGIHTPEFGFEHALDRVREAVRVDRIDYPVAVDNDYAIWRAFDNHYWPALYVADADGAIRHHQFGEGGYDRAEQVIRRLLQEAGARDLPGGSVDVEATGVEVAADWDQLASPETYLGSARAERFRSAGGPLGLNEWALDGAWAIQQEAAILQEGVGTITYRFRSRDANLVMGSSRGDTLFRVLIDGEPPGSSSGTDCDAGGHGTVSEPRLYQLVRQPGSIEEHILELTFEAPGVEAYVFTFG